MTELKKIQITEKLSPVQRLEELIMLNCPHYSKYTFNTLLQLQWCFSQKQANSKMCKEPLRTSDNQSSLRQEQNGKYPNYLVTKYKTIIIKNHSSSTDTQSNGIEEKSQR